MVDLARLVVRLEADNKKLHSELDRTARKLDGFQKSAVRRIDSVGRSILGLATGVGLTMFTRKVFAATAAQEQATAQLQRGWESTGGVVGRTVDQMIANAERLQKTSLFGDEQIIEAQSQLITFTNVTTEQFDRATQAALDLSTRMGTDLKSSIVQIGKVLNEPASQLSQLARSGIQFSDSQEAMIKSLVKSGRLVEAQNIVLGELERQFGGSAAAARDTFGGALTGLSNAFGDLLEGSNGKGGLTESKTQIESLTTLLQDPQTRAAADGLTGALISGFSKAVELATSLVTGIQDIARELARLVTGNEKLLLEQRADLQDRLQGMLRLMESPTITKEQKALITEDMRRKLAELKDVEAAIELLHLTPDAGASAPTGAGDTAGTGTAAADRGQMGPPEMTTRQKELQDQFAALQESLMTESEAFMASYDERMAIVDRFAEEFPNKEAEALEARNRIIKSKNDWALAQENKVAAARRQVAESVLDFGVALARDGSKVERTLLAIKQAIAIRESIMNMQVAMSEALTLPFPENLGAMATVASLGAGIVGNLQGVDMNVPSFLGGGYTWDGPRVGGLDGKGGRPAIVHSHEAIYDLKSGGMSAADPPIINIYEDRSRAGEIVQTQQDGMWQTDLYVSELIERGGSRTSRAIEKRYQMKRQGD